MAYETHIDTGDTAFMFTCMGLVQFMCPGLAFFYGGMVSRKNVIAMIMQNYASMGVITILWFLFAFSLSFGESLVGIFGNPFTYPTFVDLPYHRPFSRDGVEVTPGIPGSLFAGYQCMFAIITPPMMSGAFADRFCFGPYLVFISLWLVLVYCPVCHWTWGGGWMSQVGIVDWAGGLPVHITAGFSSLASLFFLGRRFQGNGVKQDDVEPHSIPFVAMGTAILWFGWFGFNGGMGYNSNGAAMLASVNTQFAAASASISYLAMDYLVGGRKPGLVSFCVGALSGLSAVTPTAGYIQPYMAMLLGFLAAIWCWCSCRFAKTWTRCGIEDSLEVWGVHGMGGFLGVTLVGIFADGPACADIKIAPVTCANPGIVTRSFMQFGKQLGAATLTAMYSVAVTLILLTVLSLFMTLKPTKKNQLDLDQAEHGEAAYAETASPLINGAKESGKAEDDRATTGSRGEAYSSAHYDEEEYGEEEGEEEEEDDIDASQQSNSFSSRALARLGYQKTRGAYTAMQ